MADLTNKEEVAFGAGIFTIGVMATAIATQTWLPDNFRVTIASVLYLIALAAGTFWAVYVKAVDPASVPLPPQVQAQIPETQPAKSSASVASSDAQAASKS